MAEKITFKIAKNRLKHRTDIEICEDGFEGWCKKSKFYDLIEKDYFWSIPKDVLKHDTKHPRRSRQQAVEKLLLTFEEAKQKFVQQGRTDIELCKDGYKGWSKKSKFYDKTVNDYWWVTPSSVFAQKSNHPRKSGNEKVDLKTAIKKFKSQRNDVILCEEDYEGWSIKGKFFDVKVNKYFYAVPKQVFREKSNHSDLKYLKLVKTSTEKYGCFHLLKNDITTKRIEALNKKFGSVSPFTDIEVRNKCKNIFMEKYGVPYPFCSDDILKKAKQTNIKKYGTEYYSQSKKGKQKNIERLSKYLIIDENGNKKFVKQWLKEQPEPKPAYTSTIQFCQKIDNFQYNHIEEKIINDYIQNYKDYKTRLEVLGEQLFETTHYNKKPKQLNKLYRPDFKLSPTIFLNIDGLYWHSDQQKENEYHFNLREEFEKAGLRIFQFREDEVRDKPEIVKSIVNNSLGKITNKTWAYECQIKTVTHKEAVLFLNENHLMGSIRAKHIGLYYNDELISLLSYKQTKNTYKIERFCSILNTNVIDGFSMLLDHLKQNCPKPDITQIHNWTDLRYETGEHLENKGFLHIKDELRWKWTDFHYVYNRLKSKTNIDNVKLPMKDCELGWTKIYDAGQRLYVKNINQPSRSG